MVRETRPEVIRITAGIWMTSYLTEKIGAIRKTEDPFQLCSCAEERRADIARREAVVGFRYRRPEEHNLATRRIGSIDYAV